jgi:hypothetical protein
VSENSVDDLNLRLRAKASPLQMEATRFRPNIILQRTPSLPPYAEDAFARIPAFDHRLTLARLGTRPWDCAVGVASIRPQARSTRSPCSLSPRTDGTAYVPPS